MSVEICEKALNKLQMVRKEKEKQYIRLFDKLSVQQSRELLDEIKDLDKDIVLAKRTFLNAKAKEKVQWGHI